MIGNISLKQYQRLPRNQVLKLKYDGEVIYVRPGFIGEFEPRTPEPILNEYLGIFFKLKDFDLYKQDSINTSNLESITIETSKIEGGIEIIDIEN